MKKIDLVLTGALASAILLTGCNQRDDWTAQRDTAVCVDRQGNRVTDAQCSRPVGGGGNGFLWYYLGRNSAIPPYGSRAYGGGFTRTSGATYFHAPVATDVSTSTAIARGGFGESAHAFGGFGE